MRCVWVKGPITFKTFQAGTSSPVGKEGLLESTVYSPISPLESYGVGCARKVKRRRFFFMSQREKQPDERYQDFC